jgi:hypothetical protein
MSEIAQALATADAAAYKRDRYRAMAKASAAEAEAFDRQAEAKRGEAAEFVGEADKQAEAYEAALEVVILATGIGREDAVKMIDVRVKLLMAAGIDMPLGEAKAKAKPAKKPKPAKAAAPKEGQVETGSPVDEEAHDGAVAAVAVGDGAVEDAVTVAAPWEEAVEPKAAEAQAAPTPFVDFRLPHHVDGEG